jgi:hypothetical protein
MTPPAPVESDVSTGEIGRRLDRFETTVTGALSDIAGKLDLRPDWADVRRIEKGLQERIQELEDWQKWAGRLIIGGVILAILGVVLVARPSL